MNDLSSQSNFNQDYIKIIENGKRAEKDTLLYEMDLMGQCRVCNNFFRSVELFLQHKNYFCVERVSEVQPTPLATTLSYPDNQAWTERGALTKNDDHRLDKNGEIFCNSHTIECPFKTSVHDGNAVDTNGVRDKANRKRYPGRRKMWGKKPTPFSNMMKHSRKLIKKWRQNPVKPVAQAGVRPSRSSYIPRPRKSLTTLRSPLHVVAVAPDVEKALFAGAESEIDKVEDSSESSLQCPAEHFAPESKNPQLADCGSERPRHGASVDDEPTAEVRPEVPSGLEERVENVLPSSGDSLPANCVEATDVEPSDTGLGSVAPLPASNVSSDEVAGGQTDLPKIGALTREKKPPQRMQDFHEEVKGKRPPGSRKRSASTASGLKMGQRSDDPSPPAKESRLDDAHSNARPAEKNTSPKLRLHSVSRHRRKQLHAKKIATVPTSDAVSAALPSRKAAESSRPTGSEAGHGSRSARKKSLNSGGSGLAEMSRDAPATSVAAAPKTAPVITCKMCKCQFSRQASFLNHLHSCPKRKGAASSFPNKVHSSSAVVGDAAATQLLTSEQYCEGIPEKKGSSSSASCTEPAQLMKCSPLSSKKTKASKRKTMFSSNNGSSRKVGASKISQESLTNNVEKGRMSQTLPLVPGQVSSAVSTVSNKIQQMNPPAGHQTSSEKCVLPHGWKSEKAGLVTEADGSRTPQREQAMARPDSKMAGSSPHVSTPPSNLPNLQQAVVNRQSRSGARPPAGAVAASNNSSLRVPPIETIHLKPGKKQLEIIWVNKLPGQPAQKVWSKRFVVKPSTKEEDPLMNDKADSGGTDRGCQTQESSPSSRPDPLPLATAPLPPLPLASAPLPPLPLAAAGLPPLASAPLPPLPLASAPLPPLPLGSAPLPPLPSPSRPPVPSLPLPCPVPHSPPSNISPGYRPM